MGIHVVTGDDQSLVLSGVTDLLHRLVGDGDRSLMVDDFDGDDYELRAVVDAAQTPPFLTDRRVVVARGVARFTADDVAPLVAYLGDPLDSTELVLVPGSGRVPKSLTDAIKRSAATTTDTAPPTRAKDRTAWVHDQLADAQLNLDAGAVNRIASWMGEDAGRLPGLLDTLVSAFGTDRRLTSADIEPFLGEAGGIPPWDLTDAIDRGDTTASLTLLQRMNDRHPLQVMAILHGHYTRLLKLDGADANDESSAAAVLGIKPGYPARKALDQYRKLGPSGVSRAIGLLAQADLDLRGARDLPESLVMEVLVARLSRLVPGRR